MRTKIEQFCRALTRRMPSKKLSSRTRRRHRLAAAADILEERTLLATFTVTSALDTVNSNDGVTTLREAIDAANSTVGFDVIQFNINGGGPTTITLNSPLPGLHDNAITIDGRTQPGYSLLNGTPLIEINGQNLPVGQAGIWITGDQAGVYGLAINRVNGVGIFFSPGANNAIIAQNHIGTDRSGTIDLGNLYQGIYMPSGGNVVVGNVISGNQANGIWLAGAGAVGNQIVENRIGVDVGGQAPLGNGINGIFASAGANSNRISGNVISDNGNTGVWLQGASFNRLQGNFIGTDITGQLDRGNTSTGLRISSGATQNYIGADLDGIADDSERNIISGNGGYGIELYDSTTRANFIHNNVIGLGIDGATAIGNGLQGVYLGGESNVLGGTEAFAGNVISANNNDGVWVVGANSQVIGNRIGTDREGTLDRGNTGDGIDVRSADNVITYNVVSGNNRHGVLFNPGSDRNQFYGNRVGTNAAGTGAIGNTFWGVWHVSGLNNQIGLPSADPNDRNVISANLQGGVAIFGANSRNAVLQNNFIGTSPDGLSDLGNAFSGVLVGDLNGQNLSVATEIIIGGTGANEGNVISGNNDRGIWIRGDVGALIQGNRIGVGADGQTPLGNTNDGIIVQGAANQIGTPGGGNIISANGLTGLFVGGSGSINNVIQGNFIGTDATGTLNRGNSDNGILLAAGAENTFVGTDGDGFSDELEGNLISGNATNGIKIRTANANEVAGNKIGTSIWGTSAIPNHTGVFFEQGAQGNVLGTNGDGVGDDLEGNLISGNTSHGVYLTGSSTRNNNIAGNLIGTARNGVDPLGNGNVGLEIAAGASANLIGTNGDGLSDNEERNLVSGNDGDGIRLFGTGTTQNVVAGNLIGTDASGVTSLGNSRSGVLILAGATENLVGGHLTQQRNIISGNTFVGVQISNAGTSQNVVAGNYIGTDISGTTAIPNQLHGIRVTDGATDNVIGTNGDGVDDFTEGNLISGNASSGIRLSDLGTNDNVIAGNFIGTTLDGSAALSNGFSGIWLRGGPRGTRIGTDGDGMADELERNVISGNMANGVFIQTTATETSIAGNYIGTDPSGTRAVANVRNGVRITNGSQHNTVGGPVTAMRNLISGNGEEGVFIANADTSFNALTGNFIGTDVTGLAALGNGSDGVFLPLGSSQNVVQTNVIAANGRDGVRITNGSNHLIQGNFIGTGVDGETPLPNNNGIFVANSSEIVIGTNSDGFADESEGNVIAANTITGITLTGVNSSGAIIAGNKIGTTLSGTAMGNGSDGVRINTSQSVVQTNVIAANGRDGIRIVGGGNHIIQGNFIGTGGDGETPLPNTNGIFIANSSEIVIGTNSDGFADESEGNVIAANAITGITLTGVASSGAIIAGNKIGTSLSGTALGNGSDGVRINTSGTRVGSNRDGVSDEWERNLIAFNGRNGVRVLEAATNNSIRSNSIHSNSGLGIDLGRDGVTANDAGDADIGPNDLQNFPTIALVESASATHVVGSLNSTPNATFVIDFYANSEVDPSGFGEGERYLGSTTVTTGSVGATDFDAVLNEVVGVGEFVTATATDEDGNTSEFSSAVGVMNTPPTSSVEPLPLVAESLEFEIEVSGSDSTPEYSGSGIAEFEVFVSTDNGPFALWTTLPGDDPVATFEAESNHLYAFRSVARDLAGNVESKPVAIEANTFVPDLEAPVSHVDDVDADTPMFTIDYSATDTGGSGLSTIQVVVEVDDGPAQIISSRNVSGDAFSSSTTYQALADGSSHTYRFYTTSTDGRGNAEAVPTDPDDVLVTADFTAPEELAVANFDVQRGASQRSFIRFLDVTFNTTVGLEDLLNEDRISLIRADLAGENSVDVSGLLSSATVEIVGQTLQIDFGAQGIGGNQNSNIGDGYYQLALDLDGDGELDEQLHFYRLFGDANGDRVVNTLDIFAVQSNYGAVGNNLDEDLNGDGVVNILDRVFAQQSLGRMLDGDLSLDN